ncbi:MAG: ABC transporter substrate-binding protein [Candidatus Microthrix sp.]|nr:ABC transporter substrate-binding protein [Candidatus Microthrix sp.]
MSRATKSKRTARSTLLLAMVSLLLVAASCGAKGSSMPEVAGGTDAAGQSADGGGSGGANAEDANFGSIESPCGPGEGKVEESEAGLGTDKLYIGVPNDRGADVRPGLLRELWDASNAYVDWCNAQGGIAGLQIETVDLDGKLFEVKQFIPAACDDVFAMVGGGSTFDDLQVEGSPSLKECGQLDMPGFTVTKAKADATDTYIAAVPNPANVRPASLFSYLAKAYPKESGDISIAYGDLDSIRFVKDQTVAVLEKLGKPFKVGDEVAYAVQGQDFKLTSQSVKSSGATMTSFIGEPGNSGLFLSSLKEDGVDIPMFVEANQYDPVLLEKGSNPLGDVLIRIPHPPFEEADDYPAIQKFEELMDARKKVDPKAKTAALGIQSMSSWLLFTEAATACAESEDHIISHDCIRSQVDKIGEWNGGGLHATTNPGKNLPAKCVIVMTIDGDKFARKFPEVGSKDANEDGYYCPEKNSTVEIDVD